MKKFFYLVMAVYIACLGMSACSRNTAAPEIIFGDNATETVVKAGESKEIAVLMKAEGKLKEIKYFRKQPGADAVDVPFETPVTKFNNPKKYECVITMHEITSNFVLVVEATDKKDRATRAEYLVQVEGQSVGAGAGAGAAFAAFYRNVRLGFNKLNSVGSSFCAATGKVVLLADAKKAQSEVDFMFFYGAKNGVTIAAPSDRITNSVFNNQDYGVQTWGKRNATTFVKVNIDFEKASLADVQAKLDGSSKTMVNHLSNGEVVAFKTASGQIGLVKLTQVGADSASTLSVSVNMLR
jgi:hypothetical protein